MNNETKLSTELIVKILRLVYEHTCPMLGIDKPFDKNERPQELTKYVKQFWSSRKRNKIFAQNLLTSDELLNYAQIPLPEIAPNVISSTILSLIEVEALWPIEIDTNGSNLEKLLLSPLGLELWNSIDKGNLFNQQQVSHEYIRQVLTKDLLLKILLAERVAWFDLIQDRVAAPRRSVDPQAVCLGLYLLLNGSIAHEHALHLVRTDKKDFKYHDTLTKGLDVVSDILYNKTLFTIPSLKDDLQRRSELTRNVGSSFRWWVPNKKGTDEYYWWEIGEYNEDSSRLDYVVKNLIGSIPTNKELEPINDRLKKLENYFNNKVGNQLSTLEMLGLFSNPPNNDFEDALRASIYKALEERSFELSMSEDQQTNKVKRLNTRGRRRA